MANAASGMAVDDECKLRFHELKTKRNSRFLIFRIDGQKVVVDKVGSPEDSYEDFTASLPDNDCRYAVYDFDFVTDEHCQKSKIFFFACKQTLDVTLHVSLLDNLEISETLKSKLESETSVICRSPDTSSVRGKMVYASSKDRFKRELDGIQVELQATDPSEMSLDIVKARAL